MSEHYFTQTPQSQSNPQTWEKQIRGNFFTFTTDDGVFSKRSVDFGTKLLIEQFQQPIIDGPFLDLGCGYGPIGIVLARTWPDRDIVMSDINRRALSLARKNAKQNDISNVEILLSDRFDNLSHQTFAAIVTNPPIRAGKQVVHQMFEESKEALMEKGELWVVIQKKQGAPSAKKKLISLFTHVKTIARRKGYHVFKATKVDDS